MKKINLGLFLVSTFLSFSFVIPETVKPTYSQTKQSIEIQRKNLSNQYKSLSDSIEKTEFLDSVSEIFTKKLLSDIIPYWYGTEWDFNGYTSQPQKGKIACGYFVSTTLRDMGLNLNRYELAKKGPENEAKSIAILEKNTSTISYDDISTLEQGLYFIGLSNHVGFLYIHQNKSYFIHSNYIENIVMIELCSESEAFSSSVYYVSSISGNYELMKSWLEKKKIVVVD